MAEQRRNSRGSRDSRGNKSSPARSTGTSRGATDARTAAQARVRQPAAQNPQNQRGKRRRRRRGSLFLLYLLIGFILTVTGITLSLTVLFNVESYKITGESRYSDAEIISAVKIKKGENLFRINKGKAADRLAQALPFLDEIKISPGLPSTLKISVKEISAAYTVENGKLLYLTAENFKILEQTAETQPGTVRIKGLRLDKPSAGHSVVFTDGKQKDRLEEIISALKSSKLKKISKIDITDSAAIKVLYDGRVNLIFGTSAELEKKLESAEEILLRQKPVDAEGTLDLSKIESGNVKSIFKEEKIEE